MEQIWLLAEFSSSDTAMQVIFIGCFGLDFQILARESGESGQREPANAMEPV